MSKDITFLKSSVVTVVNKTPPRVWLFVISTFALHKLSTDKKDVPRTTLGVPFNVIHSLEPSEEDPTALTVHRYSMRSGKLKAHAYTFESAYEREEWSIVLRHVLVSFWQRLLEKHFIQTPKFYQYHCYATTERTAGALHGRRSTVLLVLDSVEWCLVDFANNILEAGTVAAKGALKDVVGVQYQGHEVTFATASGTKICLAVHTAYGAAVVVAEIMRSMAMNKK